MRRFNIYIVVFISIVVSFALWKVYTVTVLNNWIGEQRSRCTAMAGEGAYFSRHYQCFGWDQAASVRLQFNKATDFKARKRVLLFENVYE